jgi:hypothetical protein
MALDTHTHHGVFGERAVKIAGHIGLNSSMGTGPRRDAWQGFAETRGHILCVASTEQLAYQHIHQGIDTQHHVCYKHGREIPYALNVGFRHISDSFCCVSAPPGFAGKHIHRFYGEWSTLI